MPGKSLRSSSPRVRRRRLKGAHGSKLAGGSSGVPPELRTLQSLRTIFGSARTHDTEIRRSAGISGSQLWALSEIAHCSRPSDITVNGLSAQMALHQTTTSNLVNFLVKRGLIQRCRDAADRRVVHLQVTVEGQAILSQAPGPHAGLLVDALRRLRPSQLRQLSESLEWIVALMRRTTETAAGESLMGE
jgi:DNA-binding MarR family transcriptional regulator